jgi:hypothetical protein
MDFYFEKITSSTLLKREFPRHTVTSRVTIGPNVNPGRVPIRLQSQQSPGKILEKATSNQFIRLMWKPVGGMSLELDALATTSRASSSRHLGPLVDHYSPAYRQVASGAEFRKLIELSTKMQLVGLVWTEIAGYPFDERRKRISALFGGCCHIGDSFLDDFGHAASLEYLQRFQVVLTQGWFDIRTDLERLFYVIMARLFTERDILQPMLRQAICSLFKVQALDVDLSLLAASSRPRLDALQRCCRDRSGHAITVLTLFLVPELPLQVHHVLYRTGSLISHIDDYGDFYFDRAQRKATYMNTVRNPARALARSFEETLAVIDRVLDPSRGRELLKTFLHRYFTSRLRKHQQERSRRDNSRTVYE